jgi:hypothetical protein
MAPRPSAKVSKMPVRVNPLVYCLCRGFKGKRVVLNVVNIVAVKYTSWKHIY